MTATKTFAESYPRNEEGWILFPRDVELRRRHFPNPALGSKTDVFQHPAKMQLFLVEELVKYLTEPGDWILEPFGGTGSTCYAASMGRHVIIMDVEPEFCEMIKESASTLIPGGIAFSPPNGTWTWMAPSDKFGEIRLYHGDNRQVLKKLGEGNKPPVKAIITSPPYSNALKNKGRLQASMRDEYAGSALNMGNLNPFYWEDAMGQLWKGMANVLVPGGLIAMVNKDMMKGGQRELLSTALIRGATRAGLKYKEWFKWATPGTQRTRAMLAKGGDAVLDEDIIIFEKA